jgi:CBS domain-containing protein
MSATFGAPVSAVLLAVELLLFEYRPRSLIPVALASAAAMGVRLAFHGFAPIFPIPDLTPPSGWALALYVLLGAFMGLVAVGITRILYAVEDAFDRLTMHWMWWPLIGGVVIGITGWLVPRTLGVGYANIADALGGSLAGKTLVVLVALKFVSWVISLASGMSGGTMAPLFTFGSGIGALIGAGLIALFPGAGVNVSVAGLVGMASLFAGASHAVLASVVVAFETTRQPVGLLPLLAGCSGSFLISLLLAPYSLMTEKLARRGRRVVPGYSVDYLDHVVVRDIAGKDPVCLKADQAVEEVRDWIAGRAPGSEHQGFPVLNAANKLIGVVTRRDLLDLELEIAAQVGELIHRPPVVIFDDSTGREAEDHMVRAGVGRLPVVKREEPRKVVGILTRSDLLMAHSGRLHAAHTETRALRPLARREEGRGKREE